MLISLLEKLAGVEKLIKLVMQMAKLRVGPLSHRPNVLRRKVADPKLVKIYFVLKTVTSDSETLNFVL